MRKFVLIRNKGNQNCLISIGWLVKGLRERLFVVGVQRKMLQSVKGCACFRDFGKSQRAVYR